MNIKVGKAVLRIGELVQKKEAAIKTGPFGTQLKASEYVTSGTPVINVRNIGFGIIKEDKLEYISKETTARLSSHLLREDDIVFGRKGAVERHVLIRKPQDAWLQGSDCLRLRLNSSRMMAAFASYFFLTSEHQQWMKNQCSHGATMASLNQDIIERITLPAPPISTQQKIVDILSAYDDLIENNTRRIAILEEMARLIYREWFVNFRFPSHENVKFVDSELGKIPEGWEVKTVSDAFESFGGGTPSTKNESFWTGGTINWFTPTDLTAQKSMFAERSKDRITETGLKTSSARLFPPNAVMMTSRATIGAISICTSAACTNQGFITCIPNGLFPEYWIYFWLKENVNTFIMLSSGATFKEISRGTFRKIKLIGAPQRITKLFSENVTPICKLILNLSRQNKDLRQTRDLLLPRLISGEIDVSEMEITQSKDERSRKLSKNKVSR
jgi:type I restriction enzyme S subunit